MKTSEKITQRIKDAGDKYWASDNVAKFMDEGDDQQLIEELTESFDAFRIEDIKDQHELDLVKGQRSALHRLISFETAIRSAYDSIVESDGD